MERVIVGLILIVAGTAIIRWRKELVRNGIESQNKTFGFHFGKDEQKNGERTAPFIGGFAILGGLYNIAVGLRLL